MSVLVTGATGLVGSHLVDELLARGQSVRALVRDSAKAEGLRERGVEMMIGDVRSPETLGPAVQGVDVVHHCAAAVGPHFAKAEIYDTNLHGVRHLLDALCRAGKARLVLVSSVNVLGTRHLDPATEDLPCRYSHDPAADVKIDAERLVLDYHKQGGDATIVRPGFIYGPRDTRNLPKLIGAIERGKFAYIGSRDNIVPIVHVSDVVRAMLLAAATPAASGRIYHITDGSRTTIGNLIDYLAELLGRPKPRRVLPYFVPRLACVLFEWLRRPSERPAPINRAGLRFLGTSRFVDIGRARRELGYAPQVPYRPGIAATVQWLTEQVEGKAHVGTASP